MATWKITPNWKKSTVEIQTWMKDDKKIIYEVGWRWGEFYVTTEGDEPPEIDEDTDILNSGEFEVNDWSTDDGCWDDYEYENMSEEEIEEINEFFEEGNSVFDLEEIGWYCDETSIYITCDVDIERVEE